MKAGEILTISAVGAAVAYVVWQQRQTATALPAIVSAPRLPPGPEPANSGPGYWESVAAGGVEQLLGLAETYARQKIEDEENDEG
jgi:hypothetical protein